MLLQTISDLNKPRLLTHGKFSGWVILTQADLRLQRFTMIQQKIHLTFIKVYRGLSLTPLQVVHLNVLNHRGRLE